MDLLYAELRQFLMGLGTDVEEFRGKKKDYFSFKRERRVFAYVHPRPSKGTIIIDVKPALPVQPGFVARVGQPQHKVSRSEIVLCNTHDLDKAKDFLSLCYRSSERK